MDWRWVGNCKDCLRRLVAGVLAIHEEVIPPPLIVEEIEVCPKRVVVEVEAEEEVADEPEDTSSDEGVICPHCGYLHAGAWEWERDATSGEEECESCARGFRWSIETSTTYYGQPLPDRKEGE